MATGKWERGVAKHCCGKSEFPQLLGWRRLPRGASVLDALVKLHIGL